MSRAIHCPACNSTNIVHAEDPYRFVRCVDCQHGAELFEWQGTRLRYWDHAYNNTRNNERAVELSIAGDWLHGVAVNDGKAVGGLEVGNVLGHYGCPWDRRIVDLFEQEEGVDNIDVLAIEGSYPWILSISTLEHVGVDDGTERPHRAEQAIRHLLSLLEPGGRMLVTIPFGHNAELDEAIALGALGATRECTMLRIAGVLEPPTWVMAAHPVARRPYGHEERSALSVWIGEWS